ncbi:patatin-like phospholipase family protein [Rhodobacteraceae bacterium NNCM2]|nr:patatin-like phospholipase family protein [Coraliihabitans acroporae]
MSIIKFSLALGLLALSACTGHRNFPAPDLDKALAAEPPGYRNIRFYGQGEGGVVDSEIATVRQQIRDRIAREGEVPNDGLWDALVLSGGGPDGAFGAGLLNGWTQRGDRPEFALVTGISTGALIAPFAFLGPEYDADLKKFYTETDTADIVDFAILSGLMGKAGLTDTTPIRGILKKQITPEFVAKIAEAHLDGRRLWVGTSNLDAQRPVIWNIGAIAATGREDAPELIQEVLLASASIPGAFPPVLIDVEVDGEAFTELHVDGGVTRQLFLFPADAPFRPQEEAEAQVMKRGSVYAIRNSKLVPEYAETEPGLLQIASRSVSTLLKSGGINDIAVLKQQATDSDFKTFVIAVPDSFDVPSEELFDEKYMRALFDVGYEMGLNGIPWF